MIQETSINVFYNLILETWHYSNIYTVEDDDIDTRGKNHRPLWRPLHLSNSTLFIWSLNIYHRIHRSLENIFFFYIANEERIAFVNKAGTPLSLFPGCFYFEIVLRWWPRLVSDSLCSPVWCEVHCPPQCWDYRCALMWRCAWPRVLCMLVGTVPTKFCPRLVLFSVSHLCVALWDLLLWISPLSFLQGGYLILLISFLKIKICLFYFMHTDVTFQCIACIAGTHRGQKRASELDWSHGQFWATL